jgi:hypothetical protein
MGYSLFTSPPPVTVDGQSIDSRVPEKSDDKPSFPGQTRAPYHATTPPVITTLTARTRADAPAALHIVLSIVTGHMFDKLAPA